MCTHCFSHQAKGAHTNFPMLHQITILTPSQILFKSNIESIKKPVM